MYEKKYEKKVSAGSEQKGGEQKVIDEKGVFVRYEDNEKAKTYHYNRVTIYTTFDRFNFYNANIVFKEDNIEVRERVITEHVEVRARFVFNKAHIVAIEFAREQVLS